jgi:hypothetical protein
MLTADLQALTDDIAERLSAPAVVEDDEQRMVVYSAHSAVIDEVRRDSILNRETRPQVRDWFRRYGIVQSTRPLWIPSDGEQGILGRLCIPIRCHGRLTGFLWLIDDKRELCEQQVRSAEETARYAGLLMYEELLAERLASSVLAHLLSPSEDLRDAAAQQIVDDSLLVAGAAVSINVVQLVGDPPPEARTLITEGLRDLTRRHPRGEMLALANADHGTLLVAGHRLDTNDQALHLAAETQDALHRRLGRANHRARVVVGIGDPQEDLTGAHNAYRQARLAARIAALVPTVGDLAVWSSLGAYRAIASLPTTHTAVAAADPRLDRLLSAGDPDVAETVETYLDLGGDAQATAARLHLHRGTLYYRLQKAERVAGINLRDGSDRLAIHLGFKLLRFTGRYPIA